MLTRVETCRADASSTATRVYLAQSNYPRRKLTAPNATMGATCRFIPDLVRKMEEGMYDVVSGTRYGLGGGVSGTTWYILP